jgi:hypothetical protein
VVQCDCDDDPLIRLFRLRLHRLSFAFDFSKKLLTKSAAPAVAVTGGVPQGFANTSGADASSSGNWRPPPIVFNELSEAFSLVGHAGWVPGGARLVGAATHQTGALWTNQQFHIDRSFKCQFQFRVASPLVEGFAFVIQNHSYKCLGDGGSSLGYSGIPNSIAIEFDVRASAENQDLNGNHISIQTCWAQPNSAHHRHSIGSRTPGVSLADGQIHTALIELKNGSLCVYLDDLGAGRELCAVKVDVFRLKPEAGRAWLGFTASTSRTGLVGTELGVTAATAAVDSISVASAGISILSWSFAEPGAGAGPTAAWRQLGMDCTIEPPLSLVFRPDVLNRYDSLFRFLFTVKRVQFKLQQAWLELKAARSVSWYRLGIARTVFGLRARMQFLINNLQYYLQVDVLEVQHAILLDTLSKARDFDALRRAHDAYLTALTHDCFLTHKTLLRSFEQTFDSCLALSELIMAQTASDHDGWDVAGVAALERIVQDFKTQSNFIYVILTTATTSVTSPHIAQLLTRLDYNAYFSAASFVSGSLQAGSLQP